MSFLCKRGFNRTKIKYKYKQNIMRNSENCYYQFTGAYFTSSSWSGVQTLWRGQCSHVVKLITLRKSSSLIPYVLKENWIHDYDLNEALYVNCKIDGPWVIGSDQRLGPIYNTIQWKCIKYSKSFFFTSIYNIWDNLNAWLWCPRSHKAKLWN